MIDDIPLKTNLESTVLLPIVEPRMYHKTYNIDRLIKLKGDESYTHEVCYIDHDGEQVYYKRLDLVR